MRYQSVAVNESCIDVATDAHARDDALEAVRRAYKEGLPNKAHKLLVAAREAHEDCARVSYQLGLSLLAHGNMTGLDHLKFAMAQDETATEAVCCRAVEFLMDHGESAAAKGFHNKLAIWREMRGDAEEFIRSVGSAGALSVPADVDIDLLRQALLSLRCSLSLAYVVEQARPEWFDGPLVWLVVKPRGRTGVDCEAQIVRMVHELVQTSRTIAPRICVIDEADTRLIAQIRTMSQACLWDRECSSSSAGVSLAHG